MGTRDNRIISFIGPEGVGKSTISKRIAETLGLPRVYTGDMLRACAENDQTSLGDRVRAAQKAKKYLDHTTLFEVIKPRFKQSDLQQGFVYDGGCRTLDETKAYPGLFREMGLDMPVTMVAMRIPGWMSLERLVTGENARKRDDDSLSNVLERLTGYHHELGARMRTMRDHGWAIHHVSAIPDADTVSGRVSTVLQIA